MIRPRPTTLAEVAKIPAPSTGLPTLDEIRVSLAIIADALLQVLERPVTAATAARPAERQADKAQPPGVIPGRSDTSGVTAGETAPAPRSREPRQGTAAAAVLTVVRSRGGGLASTDVLALLGGRMHKADVYHALADLVERGALTREGRRRSYTYHLAPSAAPGGAGA